jgi:lipopolysaccharide export system protein LptC
MALTNNGTAVYINDSYLPEGYTKPAITKFSDFEAKYPDYKININKSAVENENKITTFQNLVNAVTSAVSDIITADFNTSELTVTCFANLKVISHNFELDGVKYTNGAIIYICTVDIFVKTESID